MFRDIGRKTTLYLELVVDKQRGSSQIEQSENVKNKFVLLMVTETFQKMRTLKNLHCDTKTQLNLTCCVICIPEI